jgi:hypothetical protein
VEGRRPSSGTRQAVRSERDARQDHVEANAVLAATNARELFSEKHATYARFIAFVRYPQGLRAFFRRSSLLRSGGRSLDAGCGTGAATLAVHDVFVRRGIFGWVPSGVQKSPGVGNRDREECYADEQAGSRIDGRGDSRIP